MNLPGRDAAGAPDVTPAVIPLLVDGNNVMGAAADGWWRDRPGATRRLVARVRCYAAATGRPVTIVFDDAVADLPEGEHDRVTVRYATRRGRDAADDRIVELLDRVPAPVEVVTSDRALADRARRRRGTVQGAGAFLRRLGEHDC
jgi:predicted RNA-binding protein with PIN domain